MLIDLKDCGKDKEPPLTTWEFIRGVLIGCVCIVLSGLYATFGG